MRFHPQTAPDKRRRVMVVVGRVLMGKKGMSARMRIAEKRLVRIPAVMPFRTNLDTNTLSQMDVKVHTTAGISAMSIHSMGTARISSFKRIADYLILLQKKSRLFKEP